MRPCALLTAVGGWLNCRSLTLNQSDHLVLSLAACVVPQMRFWSSSANRYCRPSLPAVTADIGLAWRLGTSAAPAGVTTVTMIAARPPTIATANPEANPLPSRRLGRRSAGTLDTFI